MKSKIDFSMPMDRRTVNEWCRYWYRFNPIIGTWIDSIVSSVYSNFKLNGTNKKELDIYNREMFEKINGENRFRHEAIVKDAIREFNTIGETFIYEEVFDKIDDGKFIIQNPDYIELKKSIVDDTNVVSLIPDEELKRLVNSSSKEDVEFKKHLDKELIQMVKNNKNIPLSPTFLTVMQNIQSPYDTRGTSFLVKFFKVLLHDDYVREMMYEKGMVVKKEKVHGSIFHIIRDECKSPAFLRRLQKQREMFEKWIIEKRLGRIQKQYGLKTLPTINWNKEISLKDFKFIGFKFKGKEL